MVKWSPIEDTLLSTSYDDTIKIWKEDEDDWYCANTLKGHTSTVWSADFNSDGSMIVSVSDDCSLKIWKRQEVVEENSSFASRFVGWARKETQWECILTVEALHERAIYSVCWSKLDGLILTAGSDNTIKISKLVSQTSSENSVVEYSLDVLEVIVEPHGKQDVNCVQWYQGSSSNQESTKYFASCGDDETVRVWRVFL